MSDATEENLKLGASAIISNASVVELGQKKPWYGAVITAVLSVILAAVPILTQKFKANGSDIIATPSRGFETGLVHFQEDIRASGKHVDFKVENSSLTVTGWNEFLSTQNSGATNDEPWYHHINTVTSKVDFAVFVTDLVGDEFAAYAAKVYSGINPTNGAKIGAVTTVTVGNENSSTDSTSSSAAGASETAVHSNTLVFGKNTFRVYKANTNGGWVEGGSTTLWDYSAGELPINSLVASTPTDAASADAYLKDTKTKWGKYLDAAFEKQRSMTAWRMTGIMAAVFAFFVVFMGLMIFLMTRGKNSPYRIYTFWMTQKMAYWAAFTPALLSMILGFFITGYLLQFLFIFLFGMRVMWLSMKTFRPQA